MTAPAAPFLPLQPYNSGKRVQAPPALNNTPPASPRAAETKGQEEWTPVTPLGAPCYTATVVYSYVSRQAVPGI